MTFPADFVWGAATAAHQVEGGNWNSDCWALESARPSLFVEHSGVACDQFARYGDDLAILAGLGLNTYRFSIEWARVEPEEGGFSQQALDHYKRIIDACWSRNIQPMATFHHFTNPRWVARDGGFQNDRFPERFARYCETVACAFGDQLAYACTINEINLPDSLDQLMARVKAKYPDRVAAGEAAIGAPIESFFLFAGVAGYTARAVRTHELARDAIKSAAPHVPVGMTMSIQECEAEPGGEAGVAAYKQRVYAPYYDSAKRDDFLGVQTYTRMRFGADGKATRRPPPDAELTQMGYEYRPQALGAACRDAWAATQTPIIVTESGIATQDDGRRRAFIRSALEGVSAAMAAGVDIRGYVYWTLLDNFEWMSGYAPTFGLVGVDRRTMARAIKPSAVMIGEIARANSLEAATKSADQVLSAGAAVGVSDR
ncbi:MAG: glycoside hydrolase family 1 protein [Hyphomonadaceae bacterium]|nr:glycoside hydrolase family 1 protein [Hyphomonadaceae bacterium]